MRGTIRTLSVLAPIVTLCFGAMFSFLGALGYGFYYDPFRIILTSIGLTPGIILALIGLLMGIREGYRHHRGLWLWGQLVWPLIIVLFTLLFFNNATLGLFWWTVVIVLSLPTLLYSFLAPPQAASTPEKGHRQVVFGAILSAVVIAGIVTVLLSPFAAVSPASPVLTASAAGPQADCVHGIYPLVTLQNPSAVAVTWSATSVTGDAAPLILTPAHGTLAAHGTTEVRISGKTTGAVISVQFDDFSGAPPAVVKLLCGLER